MKSNLDNSIMNRHDFHIASVCLNIRANEVDNGSNLKKQVIR